MNLSRRTFGQATLVGAAALTGATTIPQPLTAAESERTKDWIDAHVHVWTPNTTKYPLSPNFKKADMQPPSFTADELFAHCRSADVARVVLIQMSFYEYDHSYMLAAMKKHQGVFSGVALVDYQADDVTDQMEALAAQGVRGFRLHSRGTAKDWVDDPGMARLWRKAADAGWAVCPLINPTDITYVDTLCSRFPDTTVVVDHFARIGISGTIDSGQLDSLCRLARFSNTHVKTSAFYALGKKSAPYDDLIPMIRRVADSFGPERLMWASDCPFQVQGDHDYVSSIALIRDRIDFLSASDKQWMLRGTAEKVFFS